MRVPEQNVAKSREESVRGILPRLRSLVHRMVRNSEDREDILQDVSEKLWLTLQRGEYSIENFSAWSFRVTRNVVLNFLDKKKEQAFTDIFADYIPEEFFGLDPRTPETAQFRKFILSEIHEALSELPQEQREVFELTEIEGLSIKEVAEITGVPQATLLSRKHYAVKKLRARLLEVYEMLCQ